MPNVETTERLRNLELAVAPLADRLSHATEPLPRRKSVLLRAVVRTALAAIMISAVGFMLVYPDFFDQDEEVVRLRAELDRSERQRHELQAQLDKLQLREPSWYEDWKMLTYRSPQ